MATSSQEQSPVRGFRAWAARHPVTAFLLLLFGIGYPLMALPILAHRGVIPGASLPGMLGLDTERFSALLMIVGVLLPSALWVTWAADGRAGVRTLLGRTFRWRFGWGWWLVVLFALPALTIGIALLLGDTLKPIEPISLISGELFGLLIGFLVINLWEEMAWAGVVQTRLERRHNLFVAAVLTAIPFVLIHMPFQFIGDFSAESVLAGLIALLIFGSLVRLMLGLFLRGTRDSVFAVALMHTVFNRSNNTDGIVASLVAGEARVLAALLATLVLTIVVAVVCRKRLSRAYRLELDARSAAQALGGGLRLDDVNTARSAGDAGG
jgi:membrane protease YdiL (CAAX protease family)